MSQDSLRKLDQILKQLERRSKRPRTRSPVPAIYLTLGLVLGYQLLVRFVPLVWNSLLPEPLAQGQSLPGWAGLIDRLGRYGYDHSQQIWVGLGIVFIASLLLARGPWPVRLVLWLAAVGVVFLDAAIVLIAIKTCFLASLP